MARRLFSLPLLLMLAASPNPSRAENTRKLCAHAGDVTGVAYSPDGKFLASVGIDGWLQLSRTGDGGAMLRVQAHADGALAVAIAPDSKSLATAGADGLVVVWDAATGKPLRRLKAHTGAATAVAFSPDGKLLASGGYDGRIRLWTADTGRRVRQFGPGKGRLTALLFGPGGTWLVSGGTEVSNLDMGRGNVLSTDYGAWVRLWQVATGKEVRALKIHGSSLTLARSGKLLAAGGHFPDIQHDDEGTSIDGHSQVSLADPTTGQPLPPIKWHGQAAALSPDGKFLATSSGTNRHARGQLGPNGANARKLDFRTRVWDTATGKELMRLPDEHMASVLAFAPDGKRVALGRHDGAVLLWDLEKERQTPTVDPSEVAVRPPPGDQLLRGLYDDFQELLKREKDPEPLRRAERILNRSSGWYAYDGFELLRRHRSPAGVALLLRYLVLHAERENPKSGAGLEMPYYADTFTVLTGQVLPFRGGNTRAAVEELVRTWWAPRKGTDVTDVGRMSAAEREAVTRRLVDLGSTADGRHERSPLGDAAARLRGALRAPHPDYRTWWEEDLHPALGPLLLHAAGYRADPGGGAPGRQEVVYPAVPLLAALHRRAAAPPLGKLLADERQTNAFRFTCLLALYAAGERLDTKTLLALLAREERLAPRLGMVLALRRAPLGEGGTKLVELLDDPNAHVRAAALRALPGPRPPQALPKLRALLETGRRSAAGEVYGAITAIGTLEARALLVRQLQAVLDHDAPADHLQPALEAFEAATGQQFVQPGARSGDAYRDAARRAVQWWRKQNPA